MGLAEWNILNFILAQIGAALSPHHLGDAGEGSVERWARPRHPAPGPLGGHLSGSDPWCGAETQGPSPPWRLDYRALGTERGGRGAG